MSVDSADNHPKKGCWTDPAKGLFDDRWVLQTHQPVHLMIVGSRFFICPSVHSGPLPCSWAVFDCLRAEMRCPLLPVGSSVFRGERDTALAREKPYSLVHRKPLKTIKTSRKNANTTVPGFMPFNGLKTFLMYVKFARHDIPPSSVKFLMSVNSTLYLNQNNCRSSKKTQVVMSFAALASPKPSVLSSILPRSPNKSTEPPPVPHLRDTAEVTMSL